MAARLPLLIVASTLVDYVAGLCMGRRPERRGRRPFLIASLVVNLGILLTFKYLPLLDASVRSVLGWAGISWSSPELELLLPIGISFYTFQTLGYAIDVYRGDVRPERHLGIFALFVSFFPQLVAGPIERFGDLMPQLREQRRFDPERVASGLARMLWGFFEKLVVADRIALHVDAVYAAPGEHGSASVLLTLYLFPVQLLCDFAGYSNIAIGAARVLGVELSENFRGPLLSRSIGEFWRRWHITLSAWFRDYVYVPLGGGRGSRMRRFANLTLVFALLGLWHGAQWSFLVVGLLHAGYLIGADLLRPGRRRSLGRVGRRVRDVLSVALTFHLVLLSLVVFRAGSIGDALAVLRNTFASSPGATSVARTALGAYELGIAAVAIGVLAVAHVFERRASFVDRLAARPRWVRFAVLYGLLFAVLAFGELDVRRFLYFQF